MNQSSAELAKGWIEAWRRFDMAWLREHLAEDFVHVSPFGRFDDRETYLAAVEPLARKSVTELVIRDVVAEGDRAVIRFENRTREGAVESCDWVRVENGTIREIRSFYDTARVRRVLSESEQESLDEAHHSHTEP
ncbi:MAG: nuclear transport factor 2 family protein [Thermoanaerobaculia bacterium]